MSDDQDFHGYESPDWEKLPRNEPEPPSPGSIHPSQEQIRTEKPLEVTDDGMLDLALEVQEQRGLGFRKESETRSKPKIKRKKSSSKDKKAAKKRKYKRRTTVVSSASSSSSSSSSSSDSESPESDCETTPPRQSKRKEKRPIDEGRPHPLFYAIGRKHDSDPIEGEEEKNPAGSVQRAQTYVNGRARKMKKANYPTARVAQHNALVWLFLKQAKKALEDTFDKKHVKKLLDFIKTSNEGGEKIGKQLKESKETVKIVISRLSEIISATDHEITMARICEEHGFQMVQEFEGDDLYSKDALKRVEKLKKIKKSSPQADPFGNASSNTFRGSSAKYRGRGRSTSTPYSTTQPSAYDRPYYTRGRGRGRFTTQKPGSCHSCGNWGHWQRECPKQSQSNVQGINQP